MENKIKVRCKICGKEYVGKIPKGETAYFPRKHEAETWIWNEGIKLFHHAGFMVCPGSYLDGE